MSSTLNRRFPLATVYNIKDYGATATASDNRVAIQAAIDAAYTAGGGVVFIPAETFLFDPNPGLQVKTNVILRGTGAGSILKLINSSVRNDNLVKAESWTNVTMENFTVDGNRTNQAGSPGAYTYTQYGVYVSNTPNSIVRNVVTKNMTGVGIHVYNSSSVIIDSCFSINNNYHGFELEQAIGCHLSNSRGNSNLLHGLLISPGEVAGTGSKGNSIVSCTFDSNSNYGIATNAANGDVSAWLNQGNIFTNNIITSNAFYGINFYKQDKHVFNDNYVSGNGYFGLYAFQSSYNEIQGNIFVNNSQASNGAYDEILLEGNSSGHAAANNDISSNTILMSGTPKARYGVSEATSGDGPNIISGNNIPTAGTSGKLNILNTSTVIFVDNQTAQTVGGAKTFTSTTTHNQGVAIAANASLGGTVMGVDAPFGTAALRMYNNNSGGNLQFVSPNGNSDWYAGGNNTFSVTSTQAIAQNKMLVLSGGSSSYAKVGGTIFSYSTDAGNSGTSETDLYTDSVTASTLSTNKDKLAAHYAGKMVNSATATRQLRVYFGGTAIFDTGALSLSAASDWDLDVLIIRVSSTVVRYSVKLNLTGASLSAYASVGELTGLTLSNANTLKVTGQAAGVGAATNDIVAKLGVVEWQSAP